MWVILRRRNQLKRAISKGDNMVMDQVETSAKPIPKRFM